MTVTIKKYGRVVGPNKKSSGKKKKSGYDTEVVN